MPYWRLEVSPATALPLEAECLLFSSSDIVKVMKAVVTSPFDKEKR
jgi:hypothetical protein